MTRSETLTRVGRGIGILGAAVGVLAAGLLVVYLVLPYLSISAAGVVFVDDPSNLGAENAPTIAFWAGVLVVASLLTAYVVQSENVAVLWVLAVLLSVFTVLALFSIGLFVAPFALLTAVSACLLTLGRFAGESSRTVPS